MVTNASKAILRSKIVLLKESISDQDRFISAVNVEIDKLQAQKQSHANIKQQLQNDLCDLKADTGDA